MLDVFMTVLITVVTFPEFVTTVGVHGRPEQENPSTCGLLGAKEEKKGGKKKKLRRVGLFSGHFCAQTNYY